MGSNFYMPRFVPITAAICASAMVCSAAAVQIQKISLEAHIEQLTGPDAIDCGTHRGPTWAIEPLQQSLTCARYAAQQQNPFRIVQRGAGEDSEIASGVLADRDGLVLWFEYDSAPCGGPYCAERFEAKSCLLSNVVIVRNERGLHHFSCTR